MRNHRRLTGRACVLQHGSDFLDLGAEAFEYDMVPSPDFQTCTTSEPSTDVDMIRPSLYHDRPIDTREHQTTSNYITQIVIDSMAEISTVD